MPKKLHTREVAGVRVVSTNPESSPAEVSLLTAYAEANRAERRGHVFTVQVVVCECKDPKYRVDHAHIMVTDESGELKAFDPIFSKTMGAERLQLLESKGFLKPEQVAKAVAAIAKVIKAENLFWPPNPAMEERFVHAHIADDAVRALCPPQEPGKK